MPNVFRKIALDRLSSPEELDQLIYVTSPKAWLSLMAIVIILSLTVIWGITGRITMKTYGEGIIISGGGVHNIAHQYAGSISDIKIESGDYVRKGDVIARIERYDLVDEILSKKEQLTALNSMLDDTSLDNPDLGILVYSDLKLSVNKINEAKASIAYEGNSLAKTNELTILQKELATRKAIYVDALDTDIQKLQEQLLLESTVLSEVDGRVLEVRANKGDLLFAGTSLASVSSEDRSKSTVEVVIYIPAEEGKRIMPGMDAHISPSIVNKEEYGFLVGKVVKVSEYASSLDGMMKTLGNKELVDQLAGSAAPIEVIVELIPSSQTFSGYKWSTKKGPSIKIDSGTMCSGAIVVDERKPINFVLPTLSKDL